MAVLLSGTTIGGSAAIHAGNMADHGIITTSNIGSYALTGLPSNVITTSNIGSQSVSYADYTDRAYHGIIQDTRSAQLTPNNYADYRVTWEFTNQITGISDWHSVMTMQGWHDGYAAWQIIGPSSTSAHENWYLRSGNTTSWNTLRAIIHSGNIGSQSVNYAASAGNSATTSQRSYDYLYTTDYLESSGAVYGTIFYDNNDRAYYVDPNSTSRLVQLNLGTTNTQIKSIDGVGYLRIYGSASNYLAVGPYNNNGWAYLESVGNSSGLYLYTESSGRFAFDNGDVTPYTDAENSLGNGSYRWSQVYTSGWLRQYGAQGMYNQDYGTHFYSRSGAKWAVTGSGSNIHLEFRSNHESTLRGVVYADTSNQIGFLNNGEGWSFRTNSSNNAFVHGQILTINADGAAWSSIYMNDGDEGMRELHCNSNRIGFLTQAGSWGAWCNDDGTWQSNYAVFDHIGVGQGVNTNYRVITNGDYYANGGGNFWAEGRFKQYRGSGTWHDVIDSGNIGDQSVSYASSAGNSSTTSQRDFNYLSTRELQLGSFKTYHVGTFSANATQARRFLVGKIGIDYNDWNGVGMFEVEIAEQYYFSGLRKRYVVNYGYGGVNSIHLVEFTGVGSNNADVVVEGPTQIGGDHYVLSVYVRVRYYGSYTALVKTTRSITSSNPPGVGQAAIFMDSGAENISDFTPDYIVYPTSGQTGIAAPIFYDSGDIGYYLDPNDTSNLWRFTEGTLNRHSLNSRQTNSPWSTRASQGSPYQTGAMGWGQYDLNTIGSYWGSGFIDTWSNPANAPGGSSHYVGMQAMHYNDQNGNFHGWQMVCAQESTNRWFWRSSWNVPNRPWVEMIHSGNIGSQSVSYATTAGSAPADGGNSSTVGGRSVGNEKGQVGYFDSNGNLYINNPESYSGEVRLGAAWGRGGVYTAGTHSVSTGGGAIDFVSNDNTIGAFRWDSSNGTRFIVGENVTTTPYTLIDTNKRPVIYQRGQYPVLTLDHTVTSNGVHGPTIQFVHNGHQGNQWVIGTNGAGTRLDIGFSNTASYGNTSYNPHNGIGGYNGKTLVRMTNDGVAIGSLGTYPTVIEPAYTLDVRGDIYASGTMRAPIFYDSNDTGYYLDPNGTSNLSAIVTNAYNTFNSWTNLTGSHGFYSSTTNGAHFYPNNGSYGAWRIDGTRNGWNGIEFNANNGNVSLMVNPNSNSSGFHNNNYGWQIEWTNGTLYCSKNAYGGGTQAAVLDSSNYTSYTLPIGGGWYGVNLPGARWGGYAVNGGEIVFGRDFPNTSQMGMLVDGCYAAGENNGFWSLPSNNDWNGRIGFYNDNGGNATFNARVNSASGYISNGNPWGTANSAFFPNGITTAGSTNWIYGYTYIGNAPGNGAGHEFSASGTQYSTSSITTPLFLVNNHSDNTRGYRIYNTSNSSVSAMFVNSSNQLVIAAGAVDQINLNKKVYVNGVALGVNVSPSGTAGRIDASNDIVAYSSSDERLKQNITPIENALDKVKSLTGVEFDWKPEYKHAHGYEGHDTGIIAQQVQEVIPSAVRTNDTGFLAVRYEKLIGLLVEGMKEQQAQIEELKAKLDGLTK